MADLINLLAGVSMAGGLLSAMGAQAQGQSQLSLNSSMPRLPGEMQGLSVKPPRMMPRFKSVKAVWPSGPFV